LLAKIDTLSGSLRRGKASSTYLCESLPPSPRLGRATELLVHRVIELPEEVFVLFLTLFRYETQRVDPFDADFFRVGLALQDRHDFRDKFVQRHRFWIFCLLVAHERRLNVRRDEFDHFDTSRLELVTQRLGVGMDRGFRRAISGRHRQRDKGPNRKKR
jgi:hypothetical protein